MFHRSLEGNETHTVDFDLSKFLKFEVQRGGEDSASAEQLRFNVSSNGVENDLLIFMIKFDEPDFVSIGSIQE